MTEPFRNPEPAPQWGAFALVCLAYLAVTVGEQTLSPVFPSTSDALGLSEAKGGVAFGVLALSIAAFNLVGGRLLRAVGPTRAIKVAAAVTAVGSVAAASSPGFTTLVGAQILLGAGAGLFFPAGLQSVAILAGPGRKGLAMGIYGVAFSGGLTIAALLGSLGAASGWRWSFWAAAVLAAGAVVASGAIQMPPARILGPPSKVVWRDVAGLPTVVGSVGAVCQYGAIPFLTTFAVATWGMTAGGAAAMLAVGRVVSIGAKMLAGAGADRAGARASARVTGILLAITGLGWVLLPGSWLTYALAAIFSGTVSSIFPVANLLAIERFGQNGSAIGAYRSAQIGIGAATGVVIGVAGEMIGLRPMLAIACVSPISLLWICREPQTVEAR
ncbi:MAG: MFS transporter [Ilumatobacteraceae bacterium]